MIDVVCWKGAHIDVNKVGVWEGYDPARDTDISGLTLVAGGQIDCEFTNQLGPLAVTLESFTADVGPAGVVLKWQTVSDINTRGFNVYRGGSETGPWTKLNDAEDTSPTSGSTTGNTYAFTDTTAEAGATYWYRLKDTLTARWPASRR